MTQEEIKEILEENLFKNIKTIEEADAYSKMFSQANELIEKQKIVIKRKKFESYINKHLNFSNELNNILKSKEISNYDFTNNKDIIFNSDSNYGYNIEFNIYQNNENIIFGWGFKEDNSNIKSTLGVYFSDEDKEQIKNFKSVNNEIKNLNNNYFMPDYSSWHYFRYIDIDKETSNKVADIIIKLYELIRKK